MTAALDRELAGVSGEHRLKIVSLLQDVICRRVAAIERLEDGRQLGDAGRFCAA